LDSDLRSALRRFPGVGGCELRRVAALVFLKSVTVAAFRSAEAVCFARDDDFEFRAFVGELNWWVTLVTAEVSGKGGEVPVDEFVWWRRKGGMLSGSARGGTVTAWHGALDISRSEWAFAM
jgi:hypothetical protein